LLAGAADIDNGAVLSVTGATYALDGHPVVGLPAGFSLSGATLSVDPTDVAFNSLAVGESTTLVISYNVTDEHGATAAQTATITVTGTNDVPVITGGDTASYSIAENTTGIVGTLAATDADSSDGLTWSLLSGDDSSLFTIDANTGALSLKSTAAQDYENPLHAGNDLTVQVQVSDGHTGGTDVQTVTVHITNDTSDDVVYITNPTPNVAAPVGADTNDKDSLVGTGAAHNDATINNSNFASNSADNITGGTAGQDINGNGGNDTIYAGGGNDNVSGSNGDDVLYGQAGNDAVDGGNNNDLIYGGSGNDNPLNGAGGNDFIYGGSGNDTINGGAGADVLVGGYGSDNVTGGTENDTFKFVSLADSGDTITDFTAGDKIDVTGLGFTGSFSATESVAHGLWQVADAGGGYNVYGDTDGNVNTYEFTFHVNASLSVGDFIGI
jgi:VCBS repeat-containing protein